jgi:predicted outer membrane protein
MKRVFVLPSVVTALLFFVLCTGVTYGQKGAKKGMRGGDTSFVAKNIKDNMMEIEMSKMALEKSSSQEVKDVAQLMIDDHSQMLADLRAYKGSDSSMGTGNTGSSRPGDTATASNELDMTGNRSSQMQDDSAMSDQHDMTQPSGDRKNKMKHGKAEGLMNASGSEFDRKWVAQMLKMHQAKLKELNSASATLTDPQLKTIASSAIPKIRTHIEKLTAIRQTASSAGN